MVTNEFMIKKLSILSCLTIFMMGACLILFATISGAWMYLRPHPPNTTRGLFTGVTYQREFHESPRPMIVHVVRINLRDEGIKVLVTPGDPKSDLPLKARKTSQFLQEFGAQIAINGDGFLPWYSRTILNYYPHDGDRVDVIGQAVSDGVRYSLPTDDEPTLYFNGRNQARINQPPGKPQNAISGNQVLVQQGQALSNLGGNPEPRTAVGLDKRRNELILVVVDGRQPGYSEGATLDDMAALMLSLGANEALNLDGGGSSTLVMEGSNGRPVVLNSPINNGIPGLQRPVGNHLGIFAQP